MSAITTHVLDTSRGLPAQGMEVRLQQLQGDAWRELGRSRTDADGRCRDLLPADEPLQPGDYRLSFEVGAFFSTLGVQSFYPFVTIVFSVANEPHYHVPLLLSPFGYSTYRGS